MGKASRGKRRSITRDDAQALRLAAEMIFDPRLIATFQSIKLHDKLSAARLDGITPGTTALLEAPRTPTDAPAQGDNPTESNARPGHPTPTAWAEGIRKGLRSPPLRERLNAAIEFGRQALRAEPDFERHTDRFGLDEPTRTQAERAYTATRERLLAEPAGPDWLALTMVCLGRAIATSAHEHFAEETWDELTSFMYGLESHFLAADGPRFADELLEFDNVFYEDRLPEILGSRMPFGLAELACNMADAGLFETSRQR